MNKYQTNLLPLALILAAFLNSTSTFCQVAAKVPDTIEAIKIHLPVAVDFVSTYHEVGEQPQPGNALGTDITVVQYDKGVNARFPSYYKNKGERNEDWYGWNEAVLAPFDGVVKKIKVNDVTNQPGNRGKGMAGGIIFEKINGRDTVQVLYAHLRDIQVKEGQNVEAGELVGYIGNNGYSWFPHLHIGATKGGLIKMLKGQINPGKIIPLQIVFDLKKMGALRN